MGHRDVLLVNANRMKPPIAPIGLDYIADALRAHRFMPKLLDLCWSDDPGADIAAALRNPPLAVGVTLRNTDNCYLAGSESYIDQHRQLVAAIRRHTDAPIIVGGCGYSVFGEAVRSAIGADYGIRGDGEAAFPVLLEAIAQGRRSDSTDVLQVAEPRPASPRDAVDNARYFRLGGQGGIETKRGCNHNCIYCADPAAKGARLRLRDPSAVAEEIQALVKQGVNVLHTCDAEFNIPPSHAKAICAELIAAGLGRQIQWYAYCTVAGMDEELAQLMVRAGCVGINFGVDAICDQMLGRLRRGYTAEDVRNAANVCHNAGITVMLDLLLGAPGETVATLTETVEMAARLDPACVGAALGVRIYPGTQLARDIAAAGPMHANPDLHGHTCDNRELLGPVFYIDRALGEHPRRLLYDMIAGDERFMVGDPDADANYDYSDNRRLCDAIEAGARGAYWDILRQLA